MSNYYNDINNLINLLYDFVYLKDKNTLNKYHFENLDPSNIDIYDLIKKDFDYKEVLDKSFKGKENFKILSIIPDENNKKIILKKYFKDFPLTIIIQKYNNNNATATINDVKYELFMNQVLSKFIISQNVPFFLLNICNFDMKINDIVKYDDFYKIINKEIFNNKHDKNSHEQPLISFSLYEHYHSYITMEDLFKEDLDNNEINKIIFQVIFIYSLLFNSFSNFKHGSYCYKSFLIIKEKVPRTINLKFKDTFFKLESCNYTCKLFNYKFSNISSLPNSDIVCTNFTDPSYEIYYFFKTLHDLCKNKNTQNFNHILSVIQNITSSDLFENKLVDEASFFNLHYVSIIPSQILLKNNFFTSFINMEYKDILKTDTLSSDFIGYRELSSSNIKILTGGAKKKAAKKASKKSSRKLSKLSKKIDKLKREIEEDVDTDDEEIDNLNKEIEKTSKPKKTKQEDDSDSDSDSDSDGDGDNDGDAVIDGDMVSPETEEQGDFVSEGDDMNNMDGGGKMNYKKMYEKMMTENKKTKSNSNAVATKSKSKNKASKSKKSKEDSDSTSFLLEESEAGNGQQMQAQQMQAQQMPGQQMMGQMPGQMQSQSQQAQAQAQAQGQQFTDPFNSISAMNPAQQGMNPAQQGMNFNKTSMSKKPEHALDGIQGMDLKGAVAPQSTSPAPDMMAESGVEPMFGNANSGMKMGANTDMNSVLEKLDSNSLVPLIPEMQHFTDSFMNGQGQGQGGPMPQGMGEFGGKPEILDKGLLGNYGSGPGGAGGMGEAGGLPMYDSAVSSMASSQGLGMMGGFKSNSQNDNYADDLNGIITRELNSHFTNLNHENEQSKKKKNFFLTKKTVRPSYL
jgi:hypothetical protein